MGEPLGISLMDKRNSKLNLRENRILAPELSHLATFSLNQNINSLFPLALGGSLILGPSLWWSRVPKVPPRSSKRPAFSEKKIPAATQSIDHTIKKPKKASHSGHHGLGNERRVDMDCNPDLWTDEIDSRLEIRFQTEEEHS